MEGTGQKEERVETSLVNLMGGAAVEMFDAKLKEIAQNVLDPNTPATAKRSVVLTLTLEPDDTRSVIKYGLEVIAKPSKDSAAKGVMYVGATKAGAVLTERNMKQPGLFEEQRHEVEG